jgi:hypothetical protein
MAAKSKNPSIGKAIAELWLTLSGQLFDSYHPERHYMRGPGPKWHAKHATVAVRQRNLRGIAKASA